MGKFTYLILDLIALLPVLILSFDKWVKFKNKWVFAFKAMIPVAILFIVWDVWFTRVGVWEFNYDYLLGTEFFGLPIEELMFFIAIPWVCLFLYEVFSYHFKGLLAVVKLSLFPLVIGLFCLFSLIISQGLYTLVNSLLGILMVVLLFTSWTKVQRSNFSLIYIVHLLPFCIVNGVLTSNPVVIYNNLENMGIRFFTIPLEDFVYSFNLISMCFLIYLYLTNKNQEAEKRFNT